VEYRVYVSVPSGDITLLYEHQTGGAVVCIVSSQQKGSWLRNPSWVEEPFSAEFAVYICSIYIWLFSISHKQRVMLPRGKALFCYLKDLTTFPRVLPLYQPILIFFYPTTDKSLIITKCFVCCQVCPTLLQPSGLSSLDVWWINTCKWIQAMLCCHRQKLPSELWLDRLSAHTDDCPAVVHFLLPCCYLTMYQNNIKGSNIILDSKGKWERAFG